MRLEKLNIELLCRRASSKGQQILMVDMDLSKVDEFRTNVPTALQKRKDVYTFGGANA